MRSILLGLHLYSGNKDYVYIWGDMKKAHSPELHTIIQLVNAPKNLVLITTVNITKMRYAWEV